MAFVTFVAVITVALVVVPKPAEAQDSGGDPESEFQNTIVNPDGTPKSPQELPPEKLEGGEPVGTVTAGGSPSAAVKDGDLVRLQPTGADNACIANASSQELQDRSADGLSVRPCDSSADDASSPWWTVRGTGDGNYVQLQVHNEPFDPATYDVSNDPVEKGQCAFAGDSGRGDGSAYKVFLQGCGGSDPNSFFEFVPVAEDGSGSEGYYLVSKSGRQIGGENFDANNLASGPLLYSWPQGQNSSDFTPYRFNVCSTESQSQSRTLKGDALQCAFPQGGDPNADIEAAAGAMLGGEDEASTSSPDPVPSLNQQATAQILSTWIASYEEYGYEPPQGFDSFEGGEYQSALLTAMQNDPQWANQIQNLVSTSSDITPTLYTLNNDETNVQPGTTFTFADLVFSESPQLQEKLNGMTRKRQRQFQELMDLKLSDELENLTNLLNQKNLGPVRNAN